MRMKSSVMLAMLVTCVSGLSLAIPERKKSPAKAVDKMASVRRSDWRVLGHATSVETIVNGAEIRAGRAIMRISALDDGTVRVRVALDGKFPPDNSFAVMHDALAAAKPTHPVKVTDSADSVELMTSLLRVRVEKAGMRMVFMDAAGRVLSEDDPNRPLSWKRMTLEASARALPKSFIDPARAPEKVATSFQLWKLMPEDEDYFGLGDKAGPLNRKNQAFSMWNTEAFGWQESTDPLYKSIPFFVALRAGVSYGIFFDNTFRTSFDFGKSAREAYKFAADDGPIDYYFFYGPHPKRVIERYTALTGRTPLPAIWTLGYQQCRYSYYPESRVREIADTFRAKHIPVDAIYLDIDYQRENRPFTVDTKKFPNFAGMVADMAKQGIKTIAITDMHLKYEPGYPPYESGLKGDHFVKNPDGSVFVGVVWPGPSVFPDFTRGIATREWWGSLYKDFVSMGVKGFWNDMNEPSVFERMDKTMPLDAVHRVAMPDGSVRSADHREIHNVYGMENVHATYEGMLKLQPNLRPFVLTRSSYAGGQRYAATWTGDNSSSWNHMRLSLPTLLNLGVSGYSNVGDDIGGFWGSPTPEVLTRWMELGAFNPVFRNHTNVGSADQEPWAHGPEHEAIRKKYIELRYQLMPYLYTAVEENARTGIPVMRAMFLEFPEMRDLYQEFMFGSKIMVTPQIWEFLSQIEVVLPKGDWYDYWSGERLSGNRTIQVKSTLDQLPIYVRAGAIVPQMPVVQNMDEVPQGPLQLRVYLPPISAPNDCSGSLYSDDGLTFAFRKGQENYLRMNFTCELSASGLSVHTTSEGSYQPWWGEVQLEIYGLKNAPRQVLASGHEFKPLFQNGTAILRIPKTALSEIEIQL